MLKLLKKYDRLISIAVLIISIALSIGVLFIPLDPAELTTYGYAGVFLITLLGAATLFIPGPTMVATFVVGALLNPILVSLVAGLGSALGESTGYAAGYASRALVTPQERRDTWYQRIFRWMSSHPFLTIFLLDAIPNLLGDIAGLIAGRNKYSYFKFLLASFLGKTIRFSISAYLGFGLRHFITPK
ncbi:MAG TPA: VTT domain-containing protein [Anaerolineales bacterium]|nr:VTT domain-containing protein [Anaerolineales bacterium]